MDIKTKAYNYATETGGGSSFFNMLIKQGGTTTKTIAKNGTSSVEATHSGDKTYWGFTGTVQQIISDIKSGNIKIQFAGSVASTTPYQERHIDTFHIRVTYRAPDTKRAHLIAMIP